MFALFHGPLKKKKKKSKYEKSFNLRAATVFMLIYQESLCVGIEAESVCLLLTFVLEKKLDDDNQTIKA